MTPELEQIVESIIFASPEGASTKEITRCVRGAVASVREKDGELAPESITRHAAVDEARVAAAIAHLNAIYEETGRAFRLIERPAGWRIVTRAEYSPWVRELFPEKKPARLTPSALETLVIIAYRQPMTKSGIEAVRGVSVDGPLQALLDRNVVRIAGRADLPGRPLLYETTDLFLEHFGIKTIDELPNSAELRNVKLPEPEPYVAPAKAAAAAAAAGDSPASAEASGSSNDGADGKTKRKGRAKKTSSASEESPAPTPAGPDSPADPETENEEPVAGEAAPEPEDLPVTKNTVSARHGAVVEDEPQPSPETGRSTASPSVEWTPPEDDGDDGLEEMPETGDEQREPG